MANDTQQAIDALIAKIRAAETEGSVTNIDVARIMGYLNDKSKESQTTHAEDITNINLRINSISSKIPSDAAGIASTNSNGELSASQVPSYLAKTEDIARLAQLDLFERAVQSSITYAYEDEQGEYTFYSNGSGSRLGSNYRRAYGFNMSLDEICNALTSKWIPGVPGIIPDCSVNIPVLTSALTTTLNFDYMATSAYAPKAIVLGKNGYNSVSRPISAIRAFDSASSLRSIVGVIDCRQMNNANALLYTFRRCSKLQTVLLQNIPDAITSIDFSDCPDILTTLYYDTGSGLTHTDTLQYLANNRNRADFMAEGGRTIPLRVYVHEDVYKYLYENNFIDPGDGEGITGNTRYTGTGGTRIIYDFHGSGHD